MKVSTTPAFELRSARVRDEGAANGGAHVHQAHTRLGDSRKPGDAGTLFFSRRALLGAGLGSIALSGLGSAPAAAQAPPSASLYPAKRNETYTLDRPLTPEPAASTVNNYYEFGSNYDVGKAAAKLKTRPWTITIDGLVEQPRQVGIDDLLKAVTLEERLYRHVASRRGPWRCRGRAFP